SPRCPGDTRGPTHPPLVSLGAHGQIRSRLASDPQPGLPFDRLRGAVHTNQWNQTLPRLLYRPPNSAFSRGSSSTHNDAGPFRRCVAVPLHLCEGLRSETPVSSSTRQYLAPRRLVSGRRQILGATSNSAGTPRHTPEA